MTKPHFSPSELPFEAAAFAARAHQHQKRKSATFTEVLPARKSSKRSAIEWRPVGGDAQVAGVLPVHTDRASAAYAVSEFVTGWAGRGFLFAKLTPGTDAAEESYSVFCGPRAERDRCECRGFTFAGHCKHRDAARSLIENGWL